MSRATSRPRGAAGAERGGLPAEASPWERIAAAIGALVVLAAIGSLAHDGLTASRGPAVVEVRVENVEPAAGGFVVEFVARNTGRTTAAGLLVQGDLRGAGGVAETSEAVLDYLPAGASRPGGLFFSQDPRRYRLEIRARGYEHP